MKYKVAIAGSTKNTTMMAETLFLDERFEVVFTASPAPKIIGKDKILTKNPLHNWSIDQKIENFIIDKKIEPSLADKIKESQTIDFLLVVDFGYLIPQWLLNLPEIAPLNIHPSLLPKWRGSSPGQFALLFQEIKGNTKETAVTLMIMNKGLDQGPIIAQIPFQIEKEWTQIEYYQKAFALISKKLADLIHDFAQKKIKTKEQTPENLGLIARRLDKEDSFINWEDLKKLIGKDQEKIDSKVKKELEDEGEKKLLSSLLYNQAFCQNKLDQVKLVANASKAFFPWPGLWTIVKTSKGKKRMKIFPCCAQENSLILKEVQIEGKNTCLFNECKNSIL